MTAAVWVAAILAARAAAADPVWTTLTPDPVPRTSAGAAVVGATIYVAGGSDGTNILSTFEAYCPASDTWTTLPPMPTPRGGLETSVVAVGATVYVIGGTCAAISSTVEAYDTLTGTWSVRAPLPTAVVAAAAAVSGGTIFVFGGNAGGSATNLVQAYSPTADVWAGRASMPDARYALAAVTDPVNGVIVVLGGDYPGGAAVSATVWSYLPPSNSWSTGLAPIPVAVASQAVADVNGRVQVAGGWNAGFQSGVERYDAGANTWSGALSPLTIARADSAGVSVGCAMYVIDGLTGSGVTGLVERGVPAGVVPSMSVQTTATPATASIGQAITVVVKATNTGCPDLLGVAPSLTITGGSGWAGLVSGPPPSGTPLLVSGSSASFTWTFSATAAGPVAFTGTVAGYDFLTSTTVIQASTASVLIQTPAALSATFAMLSAATLSPGDAVVLTIAVTNLGQAAAALRPGTLPVVLGSAAAQPTASPAVMTLAGGGSTVFTWVLTAGSTLGTMTVSVSVTGSDVNSGALLGTGYQTSPVVTVTGPAEPCPGVGVGFLDVYDDVVGNDDNAWGLAVSPGGTCFLAADEDNQEFGEALDQLLGAYKAGGGFSWFYQGQYNNPTTADDVLFGIALGAHRVVAVGKRAVTGWIGSFAEDGTLQWSLTPVGAAGGPDVCWGVAVDAAGDAYVAGQERIAGAQGAVATLSKYSGTGALLWKASYASPAVSEAAAFAVAVDPASGDAVIGGFEGRPDVGQGRNAIVQRYTSGGTLVWSRTGDSPAHGRDETRGVAFDGGGNVLAAGVEARPDLGQGDNGWVRQYDGAGNLGWAVTFNSPLVRANGPNDAANAVAVSRDGTIVVATQQETTGQGANLGYRRYDPNGRLLETGQLDGPASGADAGRAVGLDGQGNVYVAGVADYGTFAGRNNAVVAGWQHPGCLAAGLVVQPSLAAVGQALTVTLTVTNTGGTAVASLVPSLAAGPGATLVSFSTGPSPSGVGSLGSGASVTFTWTYLAAGPGPVTFTGTVTGSGGAGVAESAWASAGTAVVTPAALSASLLAPAALCVGQALRVTVTVTNTGADAANDVTPSTSVFVTGTGAVTLVAAPPILPSLAAGAATTFTWTYSTVGAGTLWLTVTVTATDALTSGPVSTGPVTGGPTTIGAMAALTAAAATPGFAAVGQTVTVTLTVTNQGAGDATGLLPVLALSPLGTATVTAGPAPAGPVTLTAGGGAQTFAWTVSVLGYGRLTLSFTATGADACGPATVSATGAILAGTPAALAAGPIAAGPDPVCVGRLLTISVTVTNTGQRPATGVSATLIVAGTGAALVPANPPSVSLWGGAATEFGWTLTVTGSGSLRFTASVAGTDGVTGAALLAGPLVSATLSATAPASLVMTGPAAVTAVIGQPVALSATVANVGGQVATGIVPRLAVGPSPGGSVLAGPSPAGPFDLAAGTSIVIAWTWSVGGAGLTAFTLTATGVTCVAAPVQASATAAVTGLRPADLQLVSLTLAPSTTRSGGVETATVILRNGGDAALSVTLLSAGWRGSGTAWLSGAGPSAPALPIAVPGGATQVVTWTLSSGGTCGFVIFTMTAGGIEVSTGRELPGVAAASNPATVTGLATGLVLGATTATGFDGQALPVVATVTDACGNAVAGVAVSFAVGAGGGSVSAGSISTGPAGTAAVTWTLGPADGLNRLVIGLAGGPSATVTVTTSTPPNPLLLSEPGAWLDRNVFSPAQGETLGVRIWPANADPLSVKVYTASARLVRSGLPLQPLGFGQSLAIWDGRNDGGTGVARGVFLIRVSGGGLTVLRKVVVR